MNSSVANTAILFPDIRHIESCASTNTILREQLAEGAAQIGSVLVCLDQRSGHGRLNRTWVSPPGNLALSLICPVTNWENAYQLNLLTALCLVRVIQKQTALLPLIKWPNDILLHGKKVAGILSEALPEYSAALIGVGLNLNTKLTDFPSELQPILTTLKQECAQEFSATLFVDWFLQELTDALADYQTNGFSTFRAAITALLAYRGQDVTVTEAGSEPITATVVGLDDNGFLIVKTKDNLEKILIAADVVKIGAPHAHGH